MLSGRFIASYFIRQVILHTGYLGPIRLNCACLLEMSKCSPSMCIRRYEGENTNYAHSSNPSFALTVRFGPDWRKWKAHQVRLQWVSEPHSARSLSSSIFLRTTCSIATAKKIAIDSPNTFCKLSLPSPVNSIILPSVSAYTFPYSAIFCENC